MRPSRLALGLALGACTALDVPPAETPYYREQLALAHAAPHVAVGPEAVQIRDAAAKLSVAAGAEAERIRPHEETEGLLDLESPEAREFLAKLADPQQAETVLATTTL